MKVTKWEYSIEEFNMPTKDKVIEKLNELGNQGWELTATDDVVLIFKRPIVKVDIGGVELEPLNK